MHAHFINMQTLVLSCTRVLKFAELDCDWMDSTVVVVVLDVCSRAIVKNPDLLPSTPLWHLLVDDFWGTPLRHSGSHKSYRPLCVLTFRLNYLLSGLDPFSYHLTNVLLHAAATAVYVLTVRKAVVDCRADVLLMSGLLFAVHPVHAEAVAGVVGRADVLACLFFLLAVHLYIDYCNVRHRLVPATLNGCGPAARSTRWFYFAGFAFCTCASMLSKEHGITVVAVCLVYDLFIHQRLRPNDLLALHKVCHSLSPPQKKTDPC